MVLWLGLPSIFLLPRQIYPSTTLFMTIIFAAFEVIPVVEKRIALGEFADLFLTSGGCSQAELVVSGDIQVS